MSSSIERAYTLRVKVRHYEMDAQGHVNNAVYLNYAEEAAIEHAGRLGLDWASYGGTWVVRRHEIEYRRPAVGGDELDVVTRILAFDRIRGTRRTTIVRVTDGVTLAEATTEWIYVGNDGRPRRLPAEAVEPIRKVLTD